MTVTLALWAGQPVYGAAKPGVALPRLGKAPDLTLTDQTGHRQSLSALQGKVVVLTFLYTSCVSSCPMLTEKLARIGRRLAPRAGTPVVFVAVTIDPERDTPTVLKRYAFAHRASGPEWMFLTGSSDAIAQVAHAYGVAYRVERGAPPEHTFLTSLVDPSGTLRVQYAGVRFRDDELLADIRGLQLETSSNP